MNEQARQRIKAKQAAMKGGITFRCGHSVASAQYGSSHDCPRCQHQGKVEKARQRRAKLESRKETERAAREANNEAGRLPNGAHLVLDYDAAAEQWSGCLSVEVMGRLNTFTGLHSSAESLMRDLGKRCRLWVKGL